MQKSMLLIVLMPLLLASCQSDEGDDLDKFMADAAKTMSTKVPPLPEVRAYIPVLFNVDGALLDPFKPKKLSTNSNFQPNLNRAKEPLELFPLENLKYVGALSKRKKLFALIKTPDNTIHQVIVGNYMGGNFGVIKDISEFEVTVKEIIQDDLSGDWVERISTLNLQE